MKWLSNTYDPQRPDWSSAVVASPGQSHGEAVQAMRDWLRGKMIGAPKATEAAHTVYAVEDAR